MIVLRTPIRFFLSLALASIFAQALLAQDDETYVELLAEHGIAPTSESLREYLVSLHPDGDARAQMAALIARFADDSFAVRDDAMRRLLRTPAVARDLLQQAIDGDDPEARWRADYVLRRAEDRSESILHAAMSVISARKLEGLAEPVLSAIPLCTAEYVRSQARRALSTTACEDDVELLTRALESEDPHVVVAAARAVGPLLKDQAAAELAPLLEHENDEIVLAAATALANEGERAALPALGRLLQADEIQVRVRSIRALRELTGQAIPYVAYDEDTLAASAKAWQQWIASGGETVKLNYPLSDTPVRLGRTLICFYSMNKVIELDAQGKEIWSQQVAQPWGCQGLPNGHRLIASYNARYVVEYDSKGKEVWKLDGLPDRPFSVERLENGNTLLPLYSTKRIVEYNRQKKKVWDVEAPGNPMDVKRLPSGNTLVCLLSANQVVELDRKGKVVKKLDNMFGPRAAVRLENGNTLVAQTNKQRVVEVDPSGKEVWESAGHPSPFDVQRLPSGNTLIAHSRGLVEVDKSGKTVSEKMLGGVSRVSRY